MSWFGDLLFGARPDMRYTGAQEGVMDDFLNYGERYSPTYQRDQRDYKRYRRGDDSKGKLTSWMNPLIARLGQNTESAVQHYNEGYGNTGFNAGGGALTAGADAHIRLEGQKNAGDTLGAAYEDHFSGLHDDINQEYENGQNRYLTSLAGAAGIANNPYDAQRQGGGLLGQIAKGGMDYLSGYGSKWLSKALPQPA